MIQNNISIALMAGCKDDDLAYLRKLFEKLSCKWSDIDTGIDFFTGWEFNFEGNIVRQAKVFITVDKGLI